MTGMHRRNIFSLFYLEVFNFQTYRRTTKSNSISAFNIKYHVGGSHYFFSLVCFLFLISFFFSFFPNRCVLYGDVNSILK